MYSIRYLIKKDGSQVAFWNRNANYDAMNTMWIADQFVSTTKSEILMDSKWLCEAPNFWRRKVVFAAGSPEETNFAIHINVGLEADSHKSNL